MKNFDENKNMSSDEQAGLLLEKLIYLKKYEAPSEDRLRKNRQNIIRQVRETNHKKSWSLEQMLEVNIPWFFAEPRYGIALLFIAFAGLQLIGINTQKASITNTAVFTSPAQHSTSYNTIADSTTATNSITYPAFSTEMELFSMPRGDQTILPAGNFSVKK